MSTQTTLKRTPLFEEHVSLNAKMIPFGGWEMPVQYAGILAEYAATRKQVSIFDTSHMGEFLLEGDPVQSGLDRLVTQTITDMPEKTCRYGVLLNTEGGVMDDLIVYRIAAEKWMIVVNGATMPKDAEQFEQNIAVKKSFRNVSEKTGKLDIQGPESRKLLGSLVEEIEKLDYYTFDEFTVLGERVIVSRTGYTGELGYEIYFPWEKTVDLWRAIIELGAKPAGLGVRDLLRIEMGYSLYGHELTEAISPLEAGLNRFIDWEKDFIGKEALEKIKNNGIEQKVICFVSDSRRSPRDQHKIYSESEQEVGRVTSGTFSPAVEKGIGLGFIQRDAGSKGTKILIGDERSKFSATISGRPIYKESTLKS